MTPKTQNALREAQEHLPKLLVAAATFVVIQFFPLDSQAFQINTCLRDLTFNGEALGQKGHGERANLCKYAPPKFKYNAVHEHMTAFAVAKYRGVRIWKPEPGQLDTYKYLVEDRWKNNSTFTHKTRDIIYGSWWNDDPLMLMWGQGKDLTNGMRSMNRSFSSPPKYPNSHRRNTLNAKDSIIWQSHFGQLQHLHFMTDLPKCPNSPQDRISATTEKALQWLEFTFKIATQQDGSKPTDKLDTERANALGLPSLAKNFDVRPDNVKIRTLFARSGVDDRDTRTPDVALGSMLHIIQDSFSPAHTFRILGHIEGKPAALLRDVYNYTNQKESDHNSQDGVPEWLAHYAKTGEHIYTNDPIAIGAWLINAVDKNLEWAEVEQHLRNTIFATGNLSDESRTDQCTE